MGERSEMRTGEVALYQSKPTTITAVCWTGDNTPEVRRLAGQNRSGTELFMVLTDLATGRPGTVGRLWVQKSRAWCSIEPGTYVIQEPDRSGFSPCVADVFEARYDLAHLGRTQGSTDA